MKRFGYMFVHIFVVIIPLDIVLSDDAMHQTPHIVLVDQLTKDYIAAEEKLWGVIERREDSTLQQIYNIHMDYLKRHYGEPNVLLNGQHFNEHAPKLKATIIMINETSHDIAREFFEHRNYTVLSMKAFEGIHLDKTFNIVYDLTINSTDFWQSLQNVSEKKKHVIFRYKQVKYSETFAFPL